jgi:hypothetical protein
MSTLQEVCDQREEVAKREIGRIKVLALECKKLSERSAQICEFLVEDLELRKMEAHLHKAQQHASTMQA